jgi:transcriptional regulator with XRE-family HTH domain
MAQGNFDTEAFRAALDSQRTAMNLTWKDVAAESGVSASTLTRMSQGKRPDVDGLAALLKWSGLQAEMFIPKNAVQNRRRPDVLAQITALLRADTSLKKESAAAIEEILRASYKRFKEP